MTQPSIMISEYAHDENPESRWKKNILIQTLDSDPDSVGIDVINTLADNNTVSIILPKEAIHILTCNAFDKNVFCVEEDYDYLKTIEALVGSTTLPDTEQLAITEATEYGRLTTLGETVLLIRLAAGDPSAKEMLILTNQRLALKEACSVASAYPTIELMDAFQVARMGLIRALKDFNISYGGINTPIIRFSTQATKWIRQKLRREIAYISRTIRVSEGFHQFMRIVHRTLNQMSQNGNLPSLAELVSAVGLQDTKIIVTTASVALALSSRPVLSDQEPRSGVDEPDGRLEDTFKSHDPLPHEEVELALLRAKLIEIIHSLKLFETYKKSERNLEIYLRVTGLYDGYFYTQVECKEIYGITRASVSKIIITIDASLRRHLIYTRPLKGYL